METYFHFIYVYMDDFLAVGTDFCDLSIEINRITATRTACNDQSNYLGFCLHFNRSFQKCAKLRLLGVLRVLRLLI